jgi:hypothetical protein
MLSRVMSTAEAFLHPVLALQPGCCMPQLQYHRGAPLCWPVVGLGLPSCHGMVCTGHGTLRAHSEASIILIFLLWHSHCF